LVDRDIRFDTPLYTVAEAAMFLGVPASTFSGWAKGYVRRSADRTTVGEPLLSLVPGSGSQPSVPFIGLAEGMVLAAIRRGGVPMQRIRPALLALQETIGVHHALASERLYSDGAEVLYDFAHEHHDSPAAASARELVVLRSGQRVFADVVADYLQRIEYAADGYPRLLHLPDYQRRQVVVDPARSFGQPMFIHGGARVADVIDRFQAGESLSDLAEDFGVPMDELEDAVRVASRRAA
jgi:uncharacterized protein (DUF433 family)